MHDADANDNIYDCMALHDANTTTISIDTHMNVARIVSSVAQRHIVCKRTGDESFTQSTWSSERSSSP